MFPGVAGAVLDELLERALNVVSRLRLSYCAVPSEPESPVSIVILNFSTPHSFLLLLALSLTACAENEEPSEPDEANVTAGPAGGSGSEAAPIKNVILISVDTIRADHLQLYGYDRETSPFLRSLGNRAVVFDKAISQAPWTLPSHAVMFSSDYPTALGLGNWSNQRPIPSDAVLLAEVLRRTGMRTVGIVDAGFVSRVFGFGRGFETYDESDTRTVDQSVDGFLEWVDALDEGENYFAFLHTYDVHDYDPPGSAKKKLVTPYKGPLRGKNVAQILQDHSKRNIVSQFGAADKVYVQDLYDAGIFAVDRQLRRLFRELESTGKLDETLVVITSDHGEEFFERGWTGHGYTLFDENLRVPLLFVHPSLPTRRVSEQVRLLDLAPTILDLLGLEIPESWRGESLGPLIDGEAATGRIAFSEHNHGRARFSVREGDWKVIQAIENGQIRFFNLEDDPAELLSLTGRGHQAEERLRTELAAWREENDARKARLTLESIEVDPELAEQLRLLGYTGVSDGEGGNQDDEGGKKGEDDDDQ